MVTLKREIDLQEVSERPLELGKSPKAKFTVFGASMIEKEVGSGGNTGRVYLPPDWVGKRVKIIRID